MAVDNKEEESKKANWHKKPDVESIFGESRSGINLGEWGVNLGGGVGLGQRPLYKNEKRMKRGRTPWKEIDKALAHLKEQETRHVLLKKS